MNSDSCINVMSEDIYTSPGWDNCWLIKARKLGLCQLPTLGIANPLHLMQACAGCPVLVFDRMVVILPVCLESSLVFRAKV